MPAERRVTRWVVGDSSVAAKVRENPILVAGHFLAIGRFGLQSAIEALRNLCDSFRTSRPFFLRPFRTHRASDKYLHELHAGHHSSYPPSFWNAGSNPYPQLRFLEGWDFKETVLEADVRRSRVVSQLCVRSE